MMKYNLMLFAVCQNENLCVCIPIVTVNAAVSVLGSVLEAATMVKE